jgi:hypothetical protein
MDDIIFDLDLVVTQSQSNANSRSSRPQAWAKNIVAIGGFTHRNTSTPGDDTSSGASFGPAADGRQKPDLCAYYDAIDTTNGTSGYTTGFGGTSGATPLCNGMAGLVLQMFAEGLYGHGATPVLPNVLGHQAYQLRAASGLAEKGHFSTIKALLAATSYQYPITQFGTAAQTRNRQGWGFPNVRAAYDQRERILVSDEEFALQQGEQRTWIVFVPPNTPELRVSLNYADPEGNPAVTVTRQNSVDLRVLTPTGTVYWGNNGLTVHTAATPALYNTSGGVPNDVDTTENVFLQNPPSGAYQVNVYASTVRTDGHVETAGVDDVDFGVAINGIGGSRNRESAILDLSSPATNTFDISLTNVPASGWTDGFTLLSTATSTLIAGNGNFFGVEADPLLIACLTQAPGSVFHFTPSQPGYPSAPFSFPAAIAALVQGVTFDGVAVFFNNTGGVVAVSNADRVTIQ